MCCMRYKFGRKSKKTKLEAHLQEDELNTVRMRRFVFIERANESYKEVVNENVTRRRNRIIG